MEKGENRIKAHEQKINQLEYDGGAKQDNSDPNQGTEAHNESEDDRWDRDGTAKAGDRYRRIAND